MEKYLELNQEILNKFDYKKYVKYKDYKMASSINALSITNSIISSFLKEESNLEKGDILLRVYALLQALFVSIDSLYQIAITLTKSKSFININSNKNLRELKYIRNDVVGHPSNRVISNDEQYCILDYDNITKDMLCYTIYKSNNKKSIKEVYIADIITSYYVEANNLLNELLNINSLNQDNKELIELLSIAIKRFFNNLDYMESLNKFIDLYMTFYPSANKSQHRILWRYDLICHLKRYNTKSREERDILNHSIRLELEKMFMLLTNTDFEIEINRRLPRSISAFYHVLNRHKELYIYLDNLTNTSDPLFYESLQKINDVVKKESSVASLYLNMVMKAYKDLNTDLIYSLALPINVYKRN